ncbi:MAG: hypothetical protein ACTHK2_14205 [Dokdonella sp.]|uniref:hypothetical protein n=1 Tax=Dokdonella sp. TaxID=2291710 RepID=UPI003F81AEBC
MNRFSLLAIACALGVAACAQSRMPTDEQITQLLRSERAAPTDPKAPLDRAALDCLRAWSGNAELKQGLALSLVDDAGRKDCRVRVDGFLADATRNASKLAFADVSSEAAVRRAVELAREHAPPPPKTVTRPIAGAPAAAPPMVAPPAQASVDLGSYGMDLQDAEEQCRKVQEAAGKADASASVKRFAQYCGGSLAKMRSTLETMKRNGASEERMNGTVQGARNMANNARNLLAGAQ